MVTVAVTLLLAAVPQPGAGAGVDPAKLREAACLPKVSSKFTFGEFHFDGHELYYGPRRPDERRLAEALKAFEANPNDPALCLRLAARYAASKQEEKAKALARKALELVQQRLKVTPDDGPLLALHGEALLANEQKEAAGQVLRRAVTVAPDCWQCWVTLGNWLQTQAWAGLIDPTMKGVQLRSEWSSDFGHAHLVKQLQKFKPSAAQLAQASRLLDEAEKCLERAVRPGLRGARAYQERMAARFGVGLTRGALWAYQDEEAPTSAQLMFAPEALADLHRAAEFSPNDYQAQTTAACFELLACLLTKKLNYAARDFSCLPHLSAEASGRVEAAMRRLARLADSPDRATAAGSREALALVHMFGTGDRREARAQFRRALQIEPGRESAMGFLEVCLVLDDRDEEYLALCLERVKQEDTARNRYLAAKAHAKLKQLDRVEEQVRAALKLAPADFHANLALAALLLKRSRGAEELKAAAVYLRAAKQALPANAEDSERVDWAVNQAVYLALSGETAEAWSLATDALRRDPYHRAANQLLNALGR